MQIVATANDVGARPAQRSAADQLEAAFLEEMLKYCGPSARSGAFGGGAGEEQFSSYLTQEYAAILAAKLDLGLSSLDDES
ncbi:flagellar biosynthesis protein FlgJ [Paracoccus fistulariae]|uniref:Flagellar biosynthesis protein FlgJ n=1 Tax=Paracoccus fistulariae TaxID=658446 RepID=A0ABY7SIH7_9RHOB|nr:flagellar biosynthesis protein FlgJ [Paracoccus fistulariae]MDB6181047.1 flagellar biosynthesis protein FlgJ [Paracoccus fistulariae]WCR06342.1 flagellar biosynthesis protein FlgJ [Paracoccus fistulariae]